MSLRLLSLELLLELLESSSSLSQSSSKGTRPDNDGSVLGLTLSLGPAGVKAEESEDG
jgi:hypothetical protein